MMSEPLVIVYACQTCKKALALMGPSVRDTDLGRRFVDDCQRVLPLCADCSLLAWQREQSHSAVVTA